MRTFLATIALALSFSLSASHLITGHFSFEHVSTGTATSVYKVSLVLYRDVTGIAMPTSVTAYYEKLGPNGVTSTVSLGQASNGALTGNCGSTYGIEAYPYSANVTVDNNTGYTFAYSTCCRPFAITNIANASSQSIYLSGIHVTESPPFVRTTTARKLYRASQPPMQIPHTHLKSVAPIRTVIACLSRS